MSSNVPAVVQQRRDVVEYIKTEKMQQQIQKSLPPGVNLDRFTAVTLTALNHNPDLALADRQSLYNAIVRAAQDGLLPDGNDAFLNVYATNIAPRGHAPNWIQKVQYQKMVGGILKQFEKAGIEAWAESVYDNDTFEVWGDDTGQHFIHKPTRLGKPRGERIGAYAAAKRPGGRSLIIQVMDMEDLGRVRAKSKSPDKGPWNDWTERMEQKSVLHRLKKRVATLDTEAAKELNKIDNEFDDDDEDEDEAPAGGASPRQQTTVTPTGRPSVLQAIVDQDKGGEVSEKPEAPPSEGVVDKGGAGQQTDDAGQQTEKDII